MMLFNEGKFCGDVLKIKGDPKEATDQNYGYASMNLEILN